MRLIQTDSPLVALSTNISIPEEPPAFVKVDVPVRIEPPPKYLPRLTLAHSLGSEDTVDRVVEGSKLVHDWLWFSIPREHCPEGGYVTLSADLDGTVLWQQCYRVRWKQSTPFLDEVS
jgi:hypothetical protein